MLKPLRRKYILVEVNPAHIALGKPLSPQYDPVAMAIQSHGYKASVGLKYITFQRGFKSRTPLPVSKFIKNFDLGKAVKPISFKLGVPVVTP